MSFGPIFPIDKIQCKEEEGGKEQEKKKKEEEEEGEYKEGERGRGGKRRGRGKADISTDIKIIKMFIAIF